MAEFMVILITWMRVLNVHEIANITNIHRVGRKTLMKLG
jgi:hypothetical protein